MHVRSGSLIAVVVCVLVLAGPAGRADAQPTPPPKPPDVMPQQRPPMPPPGPPPPPSTKPTEPVEKLGDNLFRIGAIRVDTARKEVSVPGVVNDVSVLEFVANTKGGFKAYESALELDTNAINFNLAMILIGLDKEHASVSKFHFDPNAPQGDPVEIWVEWTDGGKPRRIRAEQLVYNDVSKQTLTEGPWIYTGSMFIENTGYLADLDGVLIGFVHTPAPIIESPRPLAEGGYGASRFNPNLGLKPGTRVTVVVRALERAKDKAKPR